MRRGEREGGKEGDGQRERKNKTTEKSQIVRDYATSRITGLRSLSVTGSAIEPLMDFKSN